MEARIETIVSGLKSCHLIHFENRSTEVCVFAQALAKQNLHYPAIAVTRV